MWRVGGEWRVVEGISSFKFRKDIPVIYPFTLFTPSTLSTLFKE
jgi:hypothetical protein